MRAIQGSLGWGTSATSANNARLYTAISRKDMIRDISIAYYRKSNSKLFAAFVSY